MEEIYQSLTSDGLYTNSYDQFLDKYGDEEGQKQLYTQLNDDGFYSNTFEDFKTKYVSAKQSPTETDTAVEEVESVSDSPSKSSDTKSILEKERKDELVFFKED